MISRIIICIIRAAPLLALSAEAAVRAEQAATADSVQSLADALQNLARRKGVQILFQPALVRGKTAPAALDEADAVAALNQLLAGSHLTYRRTGDGTYAIVAEDREPDFQPARTAEAPNAKGYDATTSQNAKVIGNEPEVIVYGNFANTQSALLEQQREIGVTNILPSERIERMPAGSVADLSTLIPGLTEHRDEFQGQVATGEGQYITIRGFDTSYNAYSLNGTRLAQTDAASRAVSVNLFSPLAVTSIKVDKAPTADKDGDSIAGIIDFRTASAFDYAGRFGQLRAQGQWAEQAAESGQRPFGGALQLQVADRLDDYGRWGLYFAAYYQNKNSTAEEIAAQGAPVVDNDKLMGTPRQNYPNLAMNGEQWNFYRETVQRVGGNIALDYRGDDTALHFRTFLVSYTNLMNQDQQSLRTSSIDGQSPPSGNNQSTTLPGLNGQSGASILEYNATTGAFAPYGIQAGHYWQYNDYRQKLLSAEAGGQTYVRGTNLTLDYNVAISYGDYATAKHYEAGQWTKPYIGGTAGSGSGVARDGVTFDLSNPSRPVPILGPAAAAYVYDPSNAKAWNIDYWDNFSQESMVTFSQAANWAVGRGWLDAVEAGFKYELARRADDDIGNQADQRVYLGLPGIGQTSTQQPAFYSGYGPTTATFPGSTLSKFPGGSYPATFKLIDANSYKSLWASLESANPVNQAAAAAAYSTSRNNGSETRFAGYLQGQISIGDLALLPGLRYEYNRDQLTTYQTNSVTGSGFVTNRKSYGELLPGLSATWRPLDFTVFRGSIRDSYARPAFDQLYGATSISGGSNGQIIINEPNPTLKPVQSTNFDIGVERYDGDSGVVQFDAFYKALRRVIVAAGTTNSSNAIAGNVSVVDGNTTINTTLNGRDGFAAGIEASAMKRLSFLPAPFDGFGLGGNVTLQASRTSYAVSANDIRYSPLPGAPRLMYNMEISYAKNGVDAALDYSYVGLALQQTQTDEPDIYVQPTRNLNLSLVYAWTAGFEIGFSAQNLFNNYIYWATYGKGTRYLAQGANNIGGFVETGRVLMLNCAYKF